VFKAGDTVIGKAKNNKGRRGKVQSIISDGNKSRYVVEWADNAGTDTVSNRVIDYDRESQIVLPIVAAPAAAEPAPAPAVLNEADRGNDSTTTNLSATFDACLEEIAKIDGYAKFLKAVVRSGASRSGMEQIHTTELFRFLFLKANIGNISVYFERYLLSWRIITKHTVKFFIHAITYRPRGSRMPTVRVSSYSHF